MATARLSDKHRRRVERNRGRQVGPPSQPSVCDIPAFPRSTETRRSWSVLRQLDYPMAPFRPRSPRWAVGAAPPLGLPGYWSSPRACYGRADTRPVEPPSHPLKAPLQRWRCIAAPEETGPTRTTHPSDPLAKTLAVRPRHAHRKRQDHRFVKDGVLLPDFTATAAPALAEDLSGELD